MITCLNCSTSNPDGTQTCISCGAPLVEAADLPAVEAQPQAELEIPDPSPYVEPDQAQATPASAPEAPIPDSQAVQPSTLEPLPLKKDRSLAIILEIIPGLFGFLGIGWIYSGFTSAGIAWLVSFLIWNMIALVICISTAGLGCLCTLPINLIVLIASVISLNSQIQQHSEQFNP
jgi:TM2 domain-containing membrane protein YozV